MPEGRDGGATDDTMAGVVTIAGSALADGTELVAGRYRIVRWLGGGGMGRVYEAVDTELDERVALKVLKAGMSDDAIERFRREVKLTRRIQHRNVARMFDIGEHEGEKFLTMELVTGGSLKGNTLPLPWPQLRAIAEQLCAGLAAAHATGVVHRDLKPDNILLEADTGRVVITDFGIARTVEQEDGVTQVGAVIGTPRYMSPEQLNGSPIDLKSDLFSLGVMLFELATGDRPWPGDNAIAVAVAQATSEPRDMDTMTTGLPPSFAEIIAACLQIDPDNRPASATVVGDAIASGTSGLLAPKTKLAKPRAKEASLHAPTSLAVLPIACGPGDDYLSDGMREDLTDTLSTTAGIRVRPAGHVAIAVNSDPRAIGRELEVEHVVVSTLRRSPTGLRIAARLINVSDGFQIWTHKVDIVEAEILAQAEIIAGGIATALSTRAAEATRPTDPRAVEHYLRARAEMRHYWGRHMQEAADLLERAVEYAPTSPPILGAYALACVQTWVMSGLPETATRARAALDRALPLGHGEAYLAAASYWSNQGDTVRGARNLGIALVRAPMSGYAHELAGRLTVEIESLEAARHHFDTAMGLDPGRATIISGDLARLEALDGQWDSADARVQALLASADPAMVQLGWMLTARLSAWRGRTDDMRRAAQSFVTRLGDTAIRITDFMYEVADKGSIDQAAFERYIEMFSQTDMPVRQRLMGLQLLAETALIYERDDIAFTTLEIAAQRGLQDRVWLDHCPLFEKHAKTPRFLGLRSVVADRATKVLTAFRGSQTGA